MAKGRRARGTGSIRFDARRGVWVGRAPVGRLPSGRTAYREVSGPTQAAVIVKLREVRPAADTTTVAGWCRRWLAALGGKPRTRAAYTAASRVWILPAWGKLKLADVTPSKVESLAADMRAKGRQPNTVLAVLSAARAMLSGAVRDGLIPRNPVSVARKPRKAKKKIDPFPPADLVRIVAACVVPELYPVALMAATGCRIGEACALDAADFDGARVSITKTIYHGQIGTPKSENGVRTIRVPAAALPALVAAKGGRTTGPLFLDPYGVRAKPSLVRRAFYRLLKRLGLARRTPHVLRHAFCTHQLAAGFPIADLAAYVGDTPMTVMQTYCHPTGRDAADTIDALFGASSSVRD